MGIYTVYLQYIYIYIYIYIRDNVLSVNQAVFPYLVGSLIMMMSSALIGWFTVRHRDGSHR